MSDPAHRLMRLWQQNQRPDLAAFLARAGALTPDQLLAVIRVDLQQRWQSGERVPVESYFGAHPQLEADREGALVLIYGEFLLREQLGEAPSAAEYLRRFPPYAAALRLQFELHQALEEDSSPSLSPETGAPAPGAPEVPGYQLLEELGRGATSVVYKAWQGNLRRVVALKVVRADVRIGSLERARFGTEGEAVARLQHPNVVQVYDIGECRGRPYLVLEFVDGGSLAQRLAGGPMAVADAVGLVETLARAMEYVHQRGILHRDLNPANVLLAVVSSPLSVVSRRGGTSSLTPDNWQLTTTPKITDFGLAKLLVGGVGLTQTGAVLGTPSYMAPEQAEGRTREIGPATDVHALGAILYHLLTGRPPYDGGTILATLLQVRSDEPPPAVRQFRPEVSPALEALCLRCLYKRPADRYASAVALADDLARLATTPPAASVPARLPGVCLMVVGTGERLPLARAVTVLGRSTECDLRLPAPQVSRRHCRIVRTPDRVHVEDLDSSGGTLVNGQKIRRTGLHDGDQLQLGSQTFLVRIRMDTE
jgi:serine/threonine protein kinase